MDMQIFERFLKLHGINYSIRRNGKTLFTCQGLPNVDRENPTAYIGFRPETDIQVGDWLINPSGDEFYVHDKKTEFIHGKPIHLSAYILSKQEYNKVSTSQAVFNIGEVHNSIVGTQQNASIANGISAESLNELISRHNTLDKELLKEMVETLESVISGKEPVKKGILSKFAGVLQRNEWITAPLATFVLEKIFLQ